MDDGETRILITKGVGGQQNDPPGVGATTRLKHHYNCKDVMFSVIVNQSKSVKGEGN